VAKGKPVNGFCTRNPGVIRLTKATRSEKREKLQHLGVSANEMCKLWESPKDLGGGVSSAAANPFNKETSGRRWVRGIITGQRAVATIIDCGTRLRVKKRTRAFGKSRPLVSIN